MSTWLDSWDWLQSPCDSLEDKQYVKWMKESKGIIYFRILKDSYFRDNECTHFVANTSNSYFSLDQSVGPANQQTRIANRRAMPILKDEAQVEINKNYPFKIDKWNGFPHFCVLLTIQQLHQNSRQVLTILSLQFFLWLFHMLIKYNMRYYVC